MIFQKYQFSPINKARVYTVKTLGSVHFHKTQLFHKRNVLENALPGISLLFDSYYHYHDCHHYHHLVIMVVTIIILIISVIIIFHLTIHLNNL